VAVWLCGCVAVWLCGCVAVWLCGCVAVWLCAVCTPLQQTSSDRVTRGFAWPDRARRWACVRASCRLAQVAFCPRVETHQVEFGIEFRSVHTWVFFSSSLSLPTACLVSSKPGEQCLCSGSVMHTSQASTAIAARSARRSPCIACYRSLPACTLVVGSCTHCPARV
jgi:hypothetical protein